MNTSSCTGSLRIVPLWLDSYKRVRSSVPGLQSALKLRVVRRRERVMLYQYQVAATDGAGTGSVQRGRDLRTRDLKEMHSG